MLHFHYAKKKNEIWPGHFFMISSDVPFIFTLEHHNFRNTWSLINRIKINSEFCKNASVKNKSNFRDGATFNENVI